MKKFIKELINLGEWSVKILTVPVLISVIVAITWHAEGKQFKCGHRERTVEKTFQGKTLQEHYVEKSQSVVLIKHDEGLGTGFFIGEYKVATAAHVVKDLEKVDIYLKNDPTAYEGIVVHKSTDADLAIIKVLTPKPNKPLILTKQKQTIGEKVYVIGMPIGLEWSLTYGVISHTNRKSMFSDLTEHIQIDAAINGGNSGGPAFNDKGEVIGVVSYGYRETDGIGVLVPVKYVEALK